MAERGGEIPIQIIDKVAKDLHSSKITDVAIKVAEMDGNVIDKNSKKGRLQALLGEELHGASLEDKADLSLYGKIFNNPDKKDRDRRVEKYKEELLYPEVLIDKDNVPDSYFELQEKIARERNQSDLLDRSPEAKRQEAETIYNDQKKSLDNWVDYLTDKDTNYPTWFKYYVIRSVVKMGNYDKKTHDFSKRTKETTGIFPDLNREALAYTYDTLSKHYIKGEKNDDNKLNTILDGARFDKIYAFAMDKVTPASKENKEKTEGEWTKFNQDDDATALYESLQGHGTGWCTAGEETAREQLSKGDFYVYYSKDENGLNTIPRIAIRMEGGQVAEVRGIEKDQNLESNMTDIASEKYHQLPGGKKFDKKDHDMKFLTLVDNKVKDNKELTKEELRFLYKTDNEIEGFGYGEDPRIKEITSKRNIISDLNFCFEGISVYDGDIKLHNLKSVEGLKLPKNINGSLFLSNLTSVEGLILPKNINDSLYLASLTSAEGLTLPDTVGGDLVLDSLTSAEGLTLPDTVGGNLYLTSLVSDKGLKLSDGIIGRIGLDSFNFFKKQLLRIQYPQLKIA